MSISSTYFCSTVAAESSCALDCDKRSQEKPSSIRSADNSANVEECHALKQQVNDFWAYIYMESVCYTIRWQVDDISMKCKRLTETHHAKVCTP